MQTYETTFIVNPQLEDANIDRQVKLVADLITSNGGRIIKEDHLGTRRMAYEIQGLTQGYYGGFIFESSTDLPSRLERHFKLDETYLRYLTVRCERDLDKINQTTPERDFRQDGRRPYPKETSPPRTGEGKDQPTRTEPVAASSDQPTNDTSKPVTPELKPVTPASKPVTPASKPVTPAPKPVTPAPKPVTPELKPVTPEPKPVTPEPKPVTPELKPVTPELKPVTPELKPVTPELKPVTLAPKPVTPELKPVTPELKPVTPEPKPVTPEPKPVTPAPDTASDKAEPPVDAPKKTKAPSPETDSSDDSELEL